MSTEHNTGRNLKCLSVVILRGTFHHLVKLIIAFTEPWHEHEMVRRRLFAQLDEYEKEFHSVYSAFNDAV